MFERPRPTRPPRIRLASLLVEPDPAGRLAEYDRQRESSAADRPDALPTGPAGRLVERWVPGGGRTVVLLRSLAGRWRLPLVAAAALLIGVLGALALSPRSVTGAEAVPPLPVAASATMTGASGSAARLVVSVVGKVGSAGLVTLDPGARVADAVAAAGGPLPGVDLSTLNLARKLTDGEQVYVGIPVPPQAAPPAAGAVGVAPGARSTVDLNGATVEQLDALPGVGAVTAKRIVDWRTQHGRFTSVTQLRDVWGIGDAKFARLKDLVSVG